MEIPERRTRNEADADGNTLVVAFEDNPDRVTALDQWRSEHRAWTVAERPARAAFDLYERVYQLYGDLARESGRSELVLGDGLLVFATTDGQVRHPILTQRLALEFNSNVPELVFRQTDDPPELYTALLNEIAVDYPERVASAREELSRRPHHPLGVDAGPFFQRLAHDLSSTGTYVESGETRGSGTQLQISREPHIFQRRRNLGFVTALEAIREDLTHRDADMLPQSLLRIVGAHPPVPESTQASESSGHHAGAWANEDDHVLFSKPANAEQLQIARRLSRHGSVLVQGPPGTGKTHTIANLVGHLLAEGKRVLITSHTSKALSVLHQQIVEPLRPLGLSLLDTDIGSRRQLEAAVRDIVARLSEDPDALDHEATRLAERRRQLTEQLRMLRQQLLDARSSEYRPIVLDGESIAPSPAAREVKAGTGLHDWVPGPAPLGAPLPLSTAQITDLYSTNASLPGEDERELQLQLTDPADLIDPTTFQREVSEFHRLGRTDLRHGANLWNQPIVATGPEALLAILTRAKEAFRQIDGFEPWLLVVVEAGRLGGPRKEAWSDLLQEIRRSYQACQEATLDLIGYQPELEPSNDLDADAARLDRILEHVQRGGNFGRLAMLMRGDWRELLGRASIHGQEVRPVEGQVVALQALVSQQVVRRDLARRWQAQVTTIGGLAPSVLGINLEDACERLRPRIEQALNWWARVWEPTALDLTSHGFSWPRFKESVVRDIVLDDELTVLRRLVPIELDPIITSRARRLSLEAIGRKLQALVDRLAPAMASVPVAPVVEALDRAVRDLDTDAYRRAHQRLVSLHAQEANLRRRKELLATMSSVAPAWSEAIRDRMSPHHESMPPGDPVAAWRWRQLHDILEARGAVSIPALEREIEQHRTWLNENTANLIEARAWAAQIRRVRHEPRLQQSLVGWRDLINRVGRGTGQRAPRLLAQARRQMDECQGAVPVWIMPLSRVVETFDPRTTRFDVVIIDEASQSDATAMTALYLGNQVVVVGDDKQVSPLAVGQKLAPVDQLIATHLRGIPNSLLYDGQLSVYKLAEQAFGGFISLREHFRCVPEIIQFSNHLSYEGKLAPLREASSARTLPSVVPYRTEGSATGNNVNREETLTIASLMAAACEQPEYDGADFGAITLVGDLQAIEIETELRRRLPPTELERRRMLCGNPAQFQGDERDVIFLSMVDSPRGNGPLAMRNAELFQQRFNVAASRARDQLWVVYSLNHETDLQPLDLRRRLIEHALDPQAITRNIEAALAKTESPFEHEVLKRLAGAGYRVTPQVRVGAYRIDMVVEGDGKRLAVECDGDRYHPIEKLPEDMERQAILERLGWTFVRVRGSAFFRDPDTALAPVFVRLKEMEIPPVGMAAVEAPAPDLGDGADNSLLERVKRRAAELRREWAGQPGDDVETVPWSSGPPTPQPSPSQAPPPVPSPRPRPGPTTTATTPPVRSIPAPRPRPVPPATLPRELPEPSSSKPEFDLRAYLKEHRLTLIDKTAKGGSLWIVGGHEIKPIMDGLKQHGIRFNFKRGGGQATSHRDGWWYTP